jgi:hypothetical protein
MSKRKHSPEWMLARVREYLAGEGSYKAIGAGTIHDVRFSLLCVHFLVKGYSIFITGSYGA